MRFLDAIGLAYFWEKIKSWVGKNYLSLKGGNIEGCIQIDNDEDPGLRIIDGTSYLDKSLTISPTRINMSWRDEDSDGGHTVINDLDIQNGLITARSFTRIGGTATQVLMADGSVRTLNAANGICGLDANGRIPLAQLGNLDTSLFKLVTSLPSSGESNKIYIVKDGSDANDVYQEYYYTNGAWEKIGTHTVKVDLTPYAKKTEAVINMDFRGVASDGSSTSNTSIRNLVYTLGDGRVKVADVPLAEPRTTGGRPYAGQNGFMRASDKAKLDGIADGANNYSLPLAANGTRGGIKVGYILNIVGTTINYPVQLMEEKAYVSIPYANGEESGLLTYYDKKKLDRLDLSNLSDDSTVYMDGILTSGKIDKDASSVSLILVTTSDDETEVIIQAATSSLAGVMSAADKTKLDGISSGATADSAITTGEIDALFA